MSLPDLIGRLRFPMWRASAGSTVLDVDANVRVMNEAADRLESLEAQVGRLEGVERDYHNVLKAALAEPNVPDLVSRLTTYAVEQRVVPASQLLPLGKPSEGEDWAEKRAELLAWTGSAVLSGDEEFTAETRSGLYHFLCSLIGYMHAGQDLECSSPTPSVSVEELARVGDDLALIVGWRERDRENLGEVIHFIEERAAAALARIAAVLSHLRSAQTIPGTSKGNFEVDAVRPRDGSAIGCADEVQTAVRVAKIATGDE
jgi:hypothetical protein